MSQNPFLNAVAALAYIMGIASVMYLVSEYLPNDTEGFPVFNITLFLSLFVFSAAAMGFIFLSKPITLFHDGEKKEGIKLFLETLGAFAGLTLIFALISSLYLF